MLASLGNNGLDSLFKEDTVFKNIQRERLNLAHDNKFLHAKTKPLLALLKQPRESPSNVLSPLLLLRASDRFLLGVQSSLFFVNNVKLFFCFWVFGPPNRLKLTEIAWNCLESPET